MRTSMFGLRRYWSGCVGGALAVVLGVGACSRHPSVAGSAKAVPPEAKMKTHDVRPAHFANPVIAGTNPDPSACRVGDDYYLVSSSFEYFPGVPIFHSKDLVHWRQIGHVLSKESQLSLKGVGSSKGIFAPTLRCHQGTFYMITTNMEGGGSFYVTAKDPRGPWSEPYWIKESVFTMDPSLFFDDDGRVYYTRHGEGRHGGVFQAEIDIATGELKAEPKKIWSGTGGVWPEGPHLYKIQGKYYLLISEGGTSFDHMLTVARSESPWGPFESYSENPILTHSTLPKHPIQATGHADLLDTADGHYWAVLLGVRPATHRRPNLGRETFLAPVQWNDQGWPVVNRNEPIELTMPSAHLPTWAPTPEPPTREEFDQSTLALHWKFVRNPDPSSWSLEERPGFLRLNGGKASIDDVASPAMLVRAQAHMRMRLSTELHFQPMAGQRAGLVVRGSEANHFDLLVESAGEERSVVLYVKLRGEKRELKRLPYEHDQARLSVEGYPDHYEFFLERPDGSRSLLGSAPTDVFCYDAVQTFTGAYVGAYAQSDNGARAVADFAWMEYQPL